MLRSPLQSSAVHTWRLPLLPGVEVTRVENDVRLWSGHSTRHAISVIYAGAFDFCIVGLTPGQYARACQ